jgi:hypothetical protein
MNATELRSIHTLTSADVLQLGNDPRFYRVLGVEGASVQSGGRCKVSLVSTDGLAHVMLVRSSREQVLVVARPPVR